MQPGGLIERLGDSNHIVRAVVIRALKDLAFRQPDAVADAFAASKQEPPFFLVRRLRFVGKPPGK